MMMKYLACTAAAMFALLASDAARATPIDVTVGPPGTLSPSDPSAIVLTFDDLAVGSLPLYQFSGGGFSGAAPTVQTTPLSKYWHPAWGPHKYVAPSFPSAAGG